MLTVFESLKFERLRRKAIRDGILSKTYVLFGDLVTSGEFREYVSSFSPEVLLHASAMAYAEICARKLKHENMTLALFKKLVMVALKRFEYTRERVSEPRGRQSSQKHLAEFYAYQEGGKGAAYSLVEKNTAAVFKRKAKLLTAPLKQKAKTNFRKRRRDFEAAKKVAVKLPDGKYSWVIKS
jgi:hypothetical protein